MKITLNKEEIELTEREEEIYESGKKSMNYWFWKSIIQTIIILLLCAIGIYKSYAQVSTSIRTGYAFKTNQPIIAPSVSFAAHHVSISPEMIVYTKRDSPASFGLKIAYTYGMITAGFGRYFDLYTTDKIDLNRNGWSSCGFVRLDKGRFFIEADYHRGVEVCIGMKEMLSKHY